MTDVIGGVTGDNGNRGATVASKPVPTANGSDDQQARQAGDPATPADAATKKDADSGGGGGKGPPCGGGPTAEDAEIRNPPKVGGTDPSGGTITAIFSSTRQFVIYEADNQIRIMLPANYEVAKALRQRIIDLGGLRASIENLRAEPSLALSNEPIRAARETAWALAQAFEDESSTPSEQPKEILSRVDARLRNLVKSHYRKRYILANLLAFLGIEIILLTLAILFGQVFKPAGNMAALHSYAMYGAFGGLGAFLSVITGIRSVDVDITLNKWEHVFAGATRILIGVIGAVVVALALDSQFIDPTFGNADASTHPGMSGLSRQLALSFIFAFIGGFSESLVPNLLRRGEQAAGASTQNTSSDPIVKDMKP
jgi:hypothetical protein